MTNNDDSEVLDRTVQYSVSRAKEKIPTK